MLQSKSRFISNLGCLVSVFLNYLFHTQKAFAQNCDADIRHSISKQCFCSRGGECDGCILNLEYGPACWLDFTQQQERRQTLDIYIPHGGAHNTSPMLLWLHGLATDKSLVNSGVVEESLIRPALKAGYVVVSISYRHPILDLSEQPTPNSDVLMAIQFLRCLRSLEFAHHKIVVAAHSRGTLGLWSALQDDYIKRDSTTDSMLPRQSTSIQAVWAVNAGIVYWPNWIIYHSAWYTAGAQISIPPHFYTLPMLLINKGNGIHDVTPDDPPIILKYTEAEHPEPYTPEAIAEGLGNPHFNPKHGTALCGAYESIRKAEHHNSGEHVSLTSCSIEYGVSNTTMFDGALAFFQESLERPHTLVPKPRVSQLEVNVDDNVCPPILFTTGRIIFVVIAATSIVILLLLGCLAISRRMKESNNYSRRSTCACFTDCCEREDRPVSRRAYRRPCSEPGCDRFRLPGMKWCMQHGGVVMYESTVIPTN